MKKFFITTPIYYANAAPHIWHAYSSFIADTYARFKRLLWYKVKFSSWNDENSQKILQASQNLWIPVGVFLDEMEILWESTWDKLEISYTDFIRTTQKDHVVFVQSVLQKVYDQDKNNSESRRDFYKWTYDGLYCVSCEAFKKEKDLVVDIKTWKKVCPDHLKEPDKISEKNWFFRLSQYQEQLLNFYKSNTDFVVPNQRFNEVRSFVESGLEDFSISRETNNFGIKLPFDDDQVAYVWYDALLNYLTVCQQKDEDFWDESTEVFHVLWKDIVKFHAIYWPAMLMSSWFRIPDKEIVTGFFTVDGQKISKTIWNVIDPRDLIQKYDRDHIVFYLFYDIAIWSDGDFSWQRFGEMYESMLIWGRWNLVNRVTKLSEKYEILEMKFSDNLLSKLGNWIWDNVLFSFFGQWFNSKILEEKYLSNADLKKYLQDWYQIVQKCNEFIQKEQPWQKYKEENTKQLALEDLQFLLYMVKNLALLSAPFLVHWFKKIQSILNNDDLNLIKSENSLFENSFKEIFDYKVMAVKLKSTIIYDKLI